MPKILYPETRQFGYHNLVRISVKPHNVVPPVVMSQTDTGLWATVERRRATAFLVAGLMFAVDAAIVGYAITAAGEELMLLGQAFIAAGWTAGFVGLLGVYPGLADRSRRLARVGLGCVAIGIVVFVAMAIASLAYFSDVLNGDLSTLVPLFLPGVIVGSVLGFLTFGTATLRTGTHGRPIGALFVVLGLFPVVNIGSGIAGVQSMTGTLAIVVGLTLVNLAVGYLLRTEDGAAGPVEADAAGEPTA